MVARRRQAGGSISSLRRAGFLTLPDLSFGFLLGSLALPLNQGTEQTCNFLSNGSLSLSWAWLLGKSQSGMLKALDIFQEMIINLYMSYCSLLIYLFLFFSSERFFFFNKFSYSLHSFVSVMQLTLFFFFFEEHSLSDPVDISNLSSSKSCFLFKKQGQ